MPSASQDVRTVIGVTELQTPPAPQPPRSLPFRLRRAMRLFWECRRYGLSCSGAIQVAWRSLRLS